MDNEEKNYQEKSEQGAQSPSSNDGVRYKKVNLYSDDNPNAFDRHGSHPTSGGGGYYRSKDSYRRADSGGYRRAEEGSTPYRYGRGGRVDGGGTYSPNRYTTPRRGEGGEGSRYGYQHGGYRSPAPLQRGYGERRSGRYEYRGGGTRRSGDSAYSGGGGYSSDSQRPQRPRTSAYGSRKYAPKTKYSQRQGRIQYVEDHYDPDAPIRLNKYLANAGVCSRRDADKYISAGVVTVNGEIITELGTKVKRSDEVRFNNEPVNIERKVYVLLNKPKDYVTTSDDPQNRKTVMDLVKNACRERIYPVGRLDRNTTGVLLLTNDGELASKLTHPKYKKKKIYHVYLDQNVSASDMQQLANGITLDDGEVHADAIEYASATDKKQVGIEIHSGRNRIVRRMFETLGYHVTKLDRVYFAGLTKKNLRRGQWRFLTQDEVNYLKMGEFE